MEDEKEGDTEHFAMNKTGASDVCENERQRVQHNTSGAHECNEKVNEEIEEL